MQTQPNNPTTPTTTEGRPNNRPTTGQQPRESVQPEKGADITSVDFVYLFYELTPEERFDFVMLMAARIEARKISDRRAYARFLLGQLTEDETAAALSEIQAAIQAGKPQAL